MYDTQIPAVHLEKQAYPHASQVQSHLHLVTCIDESDPVVQQYAMYMTSLFQITLRYNQ